MCNHFKSLSGLNLNLLVFLTQKLFCIKTSGIFPNLDSTLIYQFIQIPVYMYSLCSKFFYRRTAILRGNISWSWDSAHSYGIIESNGWLWFIRTGKMLRQWTIAVFYITELCTWSVHVELSCLIILLSLIQVDFALLFITHTINIKHIWMEMQMG